MTEIRFYDIENFVAELKEGGTMECRLEVVKDLSSEGVLLNYKMVVTGLGRNKAILYFEMPLASSVPRLDEVVKATEEQIKVLIDKFKEDMKQKHSLSFRAGVFKG